MQEGEQSLLYISLCKRLVPVWSQQALTGGHADQPLHFSRFFPRYKMQHLPPTPLHTLKEARQIALDEGLRYVYLGNV